MRTSKTLASVGILAGLWALAGCSSMSANECMATDWRTVGYEDGVSGYSGDRVGQYRKACTKHGVSPDLTAYQQRPRPGTAGVLQTAERISHRRARPRLQRRLSDGTRRPVPRGLRVGTTALQPALARRQCCEPNQFHEGRVGSDRCRPGQRRDTDDEFIAHQGAACAVAHRHQAHGRAQGRNQGEPAATRKRSADVPARPR